MRRPATLFVLAGLLGAAHVITRALGWADHTSAIAGMPISEASNLLGPVHVLVYMAVVIVAPILAIAGTIDALLLMRQPRP